MAYLDPSISASTSFAHKGNTANIPSALHSASQQPWMVDFGAFDHLTCSNFFHL